MAGEEPQQIVDLNHDTDHDLVTNVSWVGSVYYEGPAQPLTTAGDELDDLYIDR